MSSLRRACARVTSGAGLLAATSLLACCAGERSALPPTSPTETPESQVPPKRLPALIHNDTHPWLLPTNATPTAYRLHLDIDPKQSHFTGHVEIELTLAQPSAAVVLHGRGLDVESAHISVGAQRLEASVTSRPGADTRAENDELVLRVNEAVAGPITLDLHYQGRFRGDLQGLYKLESGDSAYVFSQLQPMAARSVLPCFDEPHHKTPFTIRLRTPESSKGFSNMPELLETTSSGWTERQFATSPPMPTYLLAFAVGDLEVRSWEAAPSPAPSVPLRLLTPHGKSSRGSLALDHAARHLAALEGYFGSGHPYPKLDLVAVPEFAAGAMENVGLVTFREELLLVTDDSSLDARARMAGTMAHELAHMWFGNLVTMQWWSELWLNEGFATWMANKVVDQVQPELEVRDGFLGWLSWAMWEDSQPTARAMRQDVRTQTDTFRAFSGLTYAKGAAVLDMIENWVGHATFQRGIRSYLTQHAWKTTTSHDLFAALESAQPVQSVMDSFTSQPGVPLVGINSTCSAGRLDVTLSQQPYQPLGVTEQRAGARWQIPVCLRFVHEAASRTECLLLTEAQRHWTLPVSSCPTWIAPNAGQTGYYRSQLSADAVAALVRAPTTALSSREQIGLLMDLGASLDAGVSSIDSYMDSAATLLRDPERPRATWEHFLRLAERMDSHLIETRDRPAFERWLNLLLRPALKRLGEHDRAGDVESQRLLRRRLQSAAGALGRDPRVILRARQTATRWLADPTAVNADDAAVALPLAASTNDLMLFQQLRRFATDTTIAEHGVRALGAMGAVTDPRLVRSLLDDISSGKLPMSDARHVLQGLFSEPRLQSEIYPWFTRHFDHLAQSVPMFSLRHLVHGAIDRCSLDDRAAIEQFFEPRLKKLEGMDGILEESRDGAEQCAAFRDHHAAALHAYLTSAARRRH